MLTPGRRLAAPVAAMALMLAAGAVAAAQPLPAAPAPRLVVFEDFNRFT